MTSHRFFADPELCSDIPIGGSGGDEPKHLDLANGKRTTRTGSVLARKIADPFEIGGCPKAREDVARRSKLQITSIEIALLPAGKGNQDPCPGRLVRSFQFGPELGSETKRMECFLDLPFGQTNGSRGACRDGLQQEQ